VKLADLTSRQRNAVEATASTVLVRGGAGTGKTTVALWAARQHLERQSAQPTERVLFVTFSRTAVGQIAQRSAAALAGIQNKIEVHTFHSLGFRLLKAFGRYAGYGNESLKIESVARAKLLGHDGGRLSYDDLVPGALKLLDSPVIADLAAARWTLVICDEFQDATQEQWELLKALGSRGRLLLLADPNQMIYGFVRGVDPRRLEEAENDADQVVDLEPASQRDPSNVIPAMANAVRERRFDDPALRAALDAGRLEICTCSDDETPERVAEEIAHQRSNGCRNIGVFETTNASVAQLGAELTDHGVDFTLIGLPEAHGEATMAMARLVGAGLDAWEWSDAKLQLGVFLTAASKGSEAPLVARQLAGVPGLNPVIRGNVDAVHESLKQAADADDLIQAAIEAWPRMRLTPGQSAWQRASVSFAAIARRVLGGRSPADEQAENLISACEEVQIESALTTDVPSMNPIQLMNFHQTKGREADAVVLIYREGGWVTSNQAKEPFASDSRVLYVALTRARERVIILVPPQPHPFVAPLAALAS
jgi:DNA helicase II / ATP-dependent DNA helicase PcrA